MFFPLFSLEQESYKVNKKFSSQCSPRISPKLLCFTLLQSLNDFTLKGFSCLPYESISKRHQPFSKSALFLFHKITFSQPFESLPKVINSQPLISLKALIYLKVPSFWFHEIIQQIGQKKKHFIVVNPKKKNRPTIFWNHVTIFKLKESCK